MALLRMIDGTKRTVSHEQGVTIWNVLQGNRAADTPEQLAFIRNIKDIHLNRYNAPQDYLEAKADLHWAMDGKKGNT